MNIESSSVAIVVSFLVALIVSGVFYFRDQKIKESARWLKIILTSCRFFVIYILVFLLFKPLTVYNKENSRNQILPIIVDNTKSISISDSSILGEIYPFLDQLKEKLPNADVKVLPFSSSLNINDSISFDKQGTNFSKAQNKVISLFPKESLGSVLLITDGVSTEGGSNYLLNDIPLYAIGLGDTTQLKDSRVLKLFHNEITFLDNDFSIEGLVDFRGMKGQKQEIKLFFDGEEVYSKTVIPNNDEFFEKIKCSVSAKKKGVLPLRLIVSNNLKELNTSNNQLTHFVKVREKKQKILFVSSIPHPDVRWAKSAFHGVDHVEIIHTSFEDLKFDIKDLNAVVFVGNAGADLKKSWLDKLKNQQIGFLWITGTTGGYQNEFFQFKRMDDSNDEVFLTSNQGFKGFDLSKNFESIFEISKPISVPFGKWSFNGDKSILAFQNINGVKTDYPQILFAKWQGVQFGVLIGEGYWRLGLKDKFGMQNLIRKSIDLVSIKLDNSNFRIEGLESYEEIDDVILSAKYFNQSNELENIGLVEADLFKQDSLISKIDFLKTSDHYKVNLGKMEKGVYSMNAKFEKGTVFLKKRFSFIVKEVKVESENLVANHGWLKESVQKNGGGFYSWDDKESLIKDLSSSKNFKSVSYFESITDLLIKQKWILFLVVGLISIEWFIRKWQGTN